MPDTPATETTMEQTMGWLDIDQPAPDIAAEMAAKGQAMADAAAAKTAAERLADQQDLIGRLAPTSQAGSQVEFGARVLTDMVADVQAGRMTPEQAREALEGVEAAARGVDAGRFATDVQAEVDAARAQIAALRDLPTDTPMAEAGGRVYDYVDTAMGIMEPRIDLAENVSGAIGDMAEAVLEVRADMPGADIEAIDADLDRLDALRDQDAAAIEREHEDVAVVREQVEAAADLFRDGTIHQGMSTDEIEAVAAPVFDAIAADHGTDHADDH